MEAIERWTAHYPELEALSQALKSLHASICAIGEPGEAPCAEELRAKVCSEVGEFQELVEALCPEAERLRPELTNVPLSSLTALYVQLQSELQRCPEQSRSIGGAPLCESLREILDGAGRTAAPTANDLLEAWVQEFLREPLEELHVRSGQVAQLVQSGTALEQGLARRVQELSEQICQRGFRPDRVELMDARSVLVRQLLSSMGAKQRAVKGCEPRLEGMLRTRLQAFEEAHAASLKERRDEIARHAAISETLDRNVESLARYMQQKERAREAEDTAAAAQREQRAAKVFRVAEVFQEAFSGVLAIVEECRRDSMQRLRAQLEERIAAEVGEEFRRRLRHFRDLHSAASAHAERSLGLELRFAGWLRQAYRAMEDKEGQVASDLRAHVSSSRARMMALSSAGTAQVRAQREQMQQVVELTTKELTSCQETLAVMEFSRPSNADVAKNLRHFEQVQESSRWQQREVERLLEIEQRIREDADTVMAEACPLERDASSEERWARLLSDAEAWVAGFFYTWQRDRSPFPTRVDETDQQELSLSAFATDTSSLALTKRRMWCSPSPCAKQAPPDSTEDHPSLAASPEAPKGSRWSTAAGRTDHTQVGGSRSSRADCPKGSHDSPGSCCGVAHSGAGTYSSEAAEVKLTLSDISQCISEGSTNTTAAVSLMALSADPTGSREGTGSVAMPTGQTSGLGELAVAAEGLEPVEVRQGCSDAETEAASTPSTRLAPSTGAATPAVPDAPAAPDAVRGPPPAAAPAAPAEAAGVAGGPQEVPFPAASGAASSSSSSSARASGPRRGAVAVQVDAVPSGQAHAGKELRQPPGAAHCREASLARQGNLSARGGAGKRSMSAVTPSWPGAGHSGSFCPSTSVGHPCGAALLDSMGHPNALGPSLLGPSCIAGAPAAVAAAALGAAAAWPPGAAACARPASVPPSCRRAASPLGRVSFVPPSRFAARPAGAAAGPLAAAAGTFAGGSLLAGAPVAPHGLSRPSASMRAFSATDLHRRVRHAAGGLARMPSSGELRQ